MAEINDGQPREIFDGNLSALNPVEHPVARPGAEVPGELSFGDGFMGAVSLGGLFRRHIVDHQKPMRQVVDLNSAGQSGIDPMTGPDAEAPRKLTFGDGFRGGFSWLKLFRS